MTQIFIDQVKNRLALLVYLITLGVIRARYIQSPCPDVFTYQVDPTTNQIFGYIELNNLKMGQVAKLNINLSIGKQLPKDNVGSVTLVKSRKATFSDIVRGLPAQYRVNFPLQTLLPTVLSIALNGQTICNGYRAQGRIITTINLEHTLYTQLQSQNLAQGNEDFRFESPEETNPIIYQTRFQPQPQPPVVQPARPQTSIMVRPKPVRTTVVPPLSTSSYVCGKSSNAFLKRLSINGEFVEKGQFPWTVPLFDRTQPRSPMYICGSTIITRKHLVTAAHCVYEIDEFMHPEQILAVPGMYNTDNFFDENAKFADIDAVIPHHDYVHDDDLNDADVAVLRLKETLEFTDHIIPICPWQGENDLTKIVGQQGFVAGWGVTETGSTSVPTFIKTSVVGRRQCNDNLSRIYPRNARIFCGDGHGSAPCNGDSGSGLVLKRGNQYYLRGVVSKGQVDHNTLKCDATKYAIYIDIAPFRFWLKNVTS